MTEDPWGPSLAAASQHDAVEGALHIGERRYLDATTVGVGGMGRVEAVHDVRLERQVARKTVRDGALAARLLREARLTARLDHPGIVPVHDLGTDDEGLPYYTMRLVRGRSLSAVLAELPADAEERLALVERVHAASQAIAYAHSVGVVHRDLKPDNLMVGPYGETLVVDWGLATALDESESPLPALRLAGGEDLTAVGAVLGTPAFMAPEQARGEPVGKPADVFALGRVLEEVLGASPPPELAAIVARATAADPEARYPDGAAFEADLARWLGGRRVEAHDYAIAELLSLRLRPWRAPIGVGALALLVLVVGLAAATVRTDRQRQRAEAAEAEARRLLAASRVDLGLRAARDGDLVEAAEQLALARGTSPEAVGLEMALPESVPEPAWSTPLNCRSARTRRGGGSLACLDGGRIVVREREGSTRTWDLRATDVTWTPDGRVVALHDGALRVLDDPDWSLSGQRTLGDRRFEVPPAGVDVALVDTYLLRLVTLDPPRVVEHACPSGRGLLDMVPVDDGWVAACEDGMFLRGRGLELVDTVPTVERILSLGWTGSSLVAGTLDRELLRLDREGRVQARLDLRASGPLNQLAVSPSGRTLAVRGSTGPMQLVDVGTFGVLGSLPLSRMRFVDDRTLEGTGRSDWERWTVDALRPTVLQAGGGVSLVAWTDGGTAVFGTGEGSVGFWDDEGLRERVVAPSVVKGLLPVPGEEAVVVGFATVPRLSEVTREGVELIQGVGTRSLTYGSDGSLINTSYGQRSERITPDGRVPLGVGDLGMLGVRGVERMVFVDRSPWLSVGTPEASVPLVEQPGTGPAELSPDGRTLVYVDHTRLVVHDLEAGSSREFGVEPGVSTLYVDPRGLVAVGFVDGTLEIRDAGTGVRLARARLHTDRLASIAVQGDALLTGGWDHQVRRWSLVPVLAGRVL